MITIRGCLAVAFFCCAAPLFAQTCAAPTEIVTTGAFNSDTCSSTNQLPYLANGAIAAFGNQDVYHLRVADGTGVTLNAQPQPAVDLALFVCRNQCSTYATCVATADAGGAGFAEAATLPAGPGDYYVIVSSGQVQCGSYSLSVAAPLGKLK